jgi:1-acyl-sn-glycerol-3-phosphate acyltransferase
VTVCGSPVHVCLKTTASPRRTVTFVGKFIRAKVANSSDEWSTRTVRVPDASSLPPPPLPQPPATNTAAAATMENRLPIVLILPPASGGAQRTHIPAPPVVRITGVGTTALRRGVNGVVVVGVLVVALPAIVVAERLRAGAGRTVAAATVRFLSRLCGIRYVVDGREHLEPHRRYVVVANHSSPVDIPALFLFRPDLRFVAAAELFRIPLLGGAMRALGAIPVDRSRPTEARRGLGAVARDPDAGSVVVFAEGGIPPVGETRRFTTGAFVLAIESQVPIAPVTIHGSAHVLPWGHKIWAGPGTITVEVHEPIDTTGLTVADRKRLRDRTEVVVRAPLSPGP